MTEEEVENQLKQGHNVAVRLNIPKDEQITIIDMIRGVVTFSSNELDDKVILKGDGMPTYHLANIVDDHLMEITHVIRGEEWLSSTAHHVLLYRFFNWQAPQFAHLPLILKPTGQGKLSKRDGAKFGFPVFPLTWNGDAEDTEIYPGFKEEGFIKGALLNFLAFLGWSPGTDQEIFSLDELVDAFSIDKIVKSGARFDFDKAKWFNQQYLMALDNDFLAELISNQLSNLGYRQDKSYVAKACGMMKERVEKIADIATKGHYLFTKPMYVDTDAFQKKYKAENKNHILNMIEAIDPNGDRQSHEEKIKAYITEHSLKMGDIMPILRIGLTGTMQGPDLFDTIALLGKEEVTSRIRTILNT
jgi:glutamyl-tRNA synthetase